VTSAGAGTRAGIWNITAPTIAYSNGTAGSASGNTTAPVGTLESTAGIGSINRVIFINAPIARITVYDKALSDAQLASAALTTDLLLGKDTFKGVGITEKSITLPKTIESFSNIDNIKKLILTKINSGVGILSFFKNISLNKLFVGIGYNEKLAAIQKEINYISSGNSSLLKTVFSIFNISSSAAFTILKSLYYNIYYDALGRQTTLLLLLLDVINIAAAGTIHIFTDVFVIQMAMLIALIRRRNSL